MTDATKAKIVTMGTRALGEISVFAANSEGEPMDDCVEVNTILRNVLMAATCSVLKLEEIPCETCKYMKRKYCDGKCEYRWLWAAMLGRELPTDEMLDLIDNEYKEKADKRRAG